MTFTCFSPGKYGPIIDFMCIFSKCISFNFFTCIKRLSRQHVAIVQTKLKFNDRPFLFRNVAYLTIFFFLLQFGANTKWLMGYSRKNPNKEGWRHGMSRGIKKIECGNSRGQLKIKWNFQGWSRKNHVEFPWVLGFCFRISNECNTTLWNFQRCFCLEFSGAKWQT